MGCAVLRWHHSQSKHQERHSEKVIIVTGSDGYETAFGAGEIAPNFGVDQIMVAYEVDGKPLGADGLARIVAPGDKQGGRFVSNIVKIEVVTAH